MRKISEMPKLKDQGKSFWKGELDIFRTWNCLQFNWKRYKRLQCDECCRKGTKGFGQGCDRVSARELQEIEGSVRQNQRLLPRLLSLRGAE